MQDEQIPPIKDHALMSSDASNESGVFEPVPQQVGSQPDLQPRRRHSSHSERDKNRNRNKTSSKLRPSRKKQASRRKSLLVVSLLIVSVVSSLIVGFLIGREWKKRQVVVKVASNDEVLPTSEVMAQMDAAFEALRVGDSRKAMIGFQNAQGQQPLFGLDYLVAEAAFLADETLLAHEAAERAVTKNEMSSEAILLLDMINFNREKVSTDRGPQFSAPLDTLESSFRKYAASHPSDSKVYSLWGELLRSQGAYKSAMEKFRRGALRADSRAGFSLLSAKEGLSRLQSEPSKSGHSLSEITAMTGEQALEAAYSSMQLKNLTDSLQFLERARDCYDDVVFREILKDPAFDPFRSEPQLKGFFKKGSEHGKSSS